MNKGKFFGCISYADNILLLFGLRLKLQQLHDIYDAYTKDHFFGVGQISKLLWLYELSIAGVNI